MNDYLKSVISRYHEAIADENAAWQRRVQETTYERQEVKPTFWKDSDPTPIQNRHSKAGEVRHPFYVSLAGTSYQVQAGTVNGIMPTLGGTALNAGTPPTGTLSLSGTQYVYLKMTVTLTAAYDYVHTAVLASVLVDDASTVPTDDKDAGFYYVPLATYVAGVKTSQNISTSLTAEWCDDGTATSSATQSTEAT